MQDAVQQVHQAQSLVEYDRAIEALEKLEANSVTELELRVLLARFAGVKEVIPVSFGKTPQIDYMYTHTWNLVVLRHFEVVKKLDVPFLRWVLFMMTCTEEEGRSQKCYKINHFAMRAVRLVAMGMP